MFCSQTWKQAPQILDFTNPTHSSMWLSRDWYNCSHGNFHITKSPQWSAIITELCNSRYTLVCGFVVVLCHTVFQLYIGWDMMCEMRRKPEPTLLLTQGVFTLPHRTVMAWEELAFEDAASHTQWGKGLQHSYMSWQWHASYPCPQGHQPSAITNWAIFPSLWK